MQLLLNDSYLPGTTSLPHSLTQELLTLNTRCFGPCSFFTRCWDHEETRRLGHFGHALRRHHHPIKGNHATDPTYCHRPLLTNKALYDYILPVEPVRNPNPSNLYLMGRPDLAYAFTKIALWRQTQFRKIVYLDADVVVLRALDELFDLDAFFAAAPDVGWPDAFNTGVMVLTPNMGEYWALQTMAASGDSFDGADQGLLNQYYEHRPWHRLSFAYNCTPNAQYQWEPAYRYYKRGIAAVHFIGKDKPWNHARRPGSGVHSELLGRWWAVHDRHLQDAKATAPGRVGGAQGPGQDHGSGETASTILGTPAAHHLTSIPEVVEPEAPVTTTEPPLSEPPQPGEVINQGVVEPTPTVPERKFSPPQMEWDATM